jgi:hypothetical protein
MSIRNPVAKPEWDTLYFFLRFWCSLCDVVCLPTAPIELALIQDQNDQSILIKGVCATSWRGERMLRHWEASWELGVSMFWFCHPNKVELQDWFARGTSLLVAHCGKLDKCRAGSGTMSGGRSSCYIEAGDEESGIIACQYASTMLARRIQIDDGWLGGLQ